MDAAAILLGFGVALIVVGVLYRTPFPVQPMKAIGAVAIAQGAAAGLTAAAVVGAGLVTGLVWLVLGLTGMAKRAADLIPRPALLGVILGLGFSFMLEGIRMMAGSPWISGTLLAMTLLMLSRSRFPAMLVLLAMGFLVALIEQPGLAKELTGIRVSAKLPWPIDVACNRLPNLSTQITTRSSRVKAEMPLASGSGPASTISTSSAFSCASSLGGRPSRGWSASPSRPCSLYRMTQSRNVCRSMLAARAA